MHETEMISFTPLTNVCVYMIVEAADVFDAYLIGVSAVQ